MQRLRSVWQNPWTGAGVILSFLAILFFISFQFIELIEPTQNPYTGLWSFLVLPAVLVVGLILIPIGWLLETRRRRRLFPDVHDWPRYPNVDMNNPRHRKGIMIFGLGSLLVVPLIGVSSYEGYHYTDSTQFCGQVCHQVMSPEYTSYLNSPHARVSCAACHIGAGASWYVKSKISGVRQVFAVIFHTYQQPIPTPIEDLRPARETCEQCHWPEKFFGSQLRTRVHYASDEKNTRTEIRVLVKTGGADSSQGPASGIHWHMALSSKIEYIAADKRRQVIPWVRTTEPSGRVTVYRSDGKTSLDPPPAGELRSIDCMDCHNRPTHNIQPPDRAVNTSLETGRIDRTLPWAKKVAVEALTEPYTSYEESDLKIATYIRDFYERTDPQIAELRKSSINQMIDDVRQLYRRNFFPSMNADWLTYPDNIGHMIYDGCYRCHEGKHISNDKGAIRKDCEVCHEFQLPMQVVESAKAFRQIAPAHPYELKGIHTQLKCSMCHDGGRAPSPSCEGCHQTQSLFRAGKSPVLPGLQGTPPALMADLSCDSCHDLDNPALPHAALSCTTCHEEGYDDILRQWKEDAAAARTQAVAALDGMRRAIESGEIDEQTGKPLLDQMQKALEDVDKAGPHHNPEFADAVYQQITKLASENGKQSANAGGAH